MRAVSSWQRVLTRNIDKKRNKDLEICDSSNLFLQLLWEPGTKGAESRLCQTTMQWDISSHPLATHCTIDSGTALHCGNLEGWDWQNSATLLFAFLIMETKTFCILLICPFRKQTPTCKMSRFLAFTVYCNVLTARLCCDEYLFDKHKL